MIRNLHAIRPEKFSFWVKSFVLFAMVNAFLLTPVFAQETAVFKEYKGTVIDAKTKKSMEFATISVTNSNISTVSNIDGTFLIKVPNELQSQSVKVSYLGYKNRLVPLNSFSGDDFKIRMEEAFEELPDVNIVDANPDKVIDMVMKNRKENSYRDPMIVKAFYRESIKKRKTYASLAEGVVDIYKQPAGDYIKLEKARKSTDYRKIDTLVIKLQGGPYNNLGMDMMRNKELFFTPDIFEIYNFTFDKVITMGDQTVYVIDFVQKRTIVEPFYMGKLYVDTETYGLVKAVYSLNLENLNKAKKFFVKRKPVHADVIPTNTKYVTDYRLNNGKWHYSYSRIELNFKVKWDKKLFNSQYQVTIEMAVTDWASNIDKASVRNKERMRKNVILTDQASGFSDPLFWGERNVIEPDKSIHNAIKKIQKNYEKSK